MVLRRLFTCRHDTRSHTHAHTHATQPAHTLPRAWPVTHSSLSICLFSLSHTCSWSHCPLCVVILRIAPIPPTLDQSFKSAAFCERMLTCVCMCAFLCVFCVCYLVIDYKRLFNFVSPHVGINLHSLSGVNGVSRWLARKIFEDCRLAGVCIQPLALLLLIDLLFPFRFSGCFGFSSFCVSYSSEYAIWCSSSTALTILINGFEWEMLAWMFWRALKWLNYIFHLALNI